MHIDNIVKPIWPAPRKPAAGLVVSKTKIANVGCDLPNGVGYDFVKFDLSGKSPAWWHRRKIAETARRISRRAFSSSDAAIALGRKSID